MLLKRLMAGFALGATAALMLVADIRLAPVYPFLLVITLVTGTIATRELVGLMPPGNRPPFGIALLGVLAVLSANWAGVVFGPIDPWRTVLFAFSAAIVMAFCYEMRTYTIEGECGLRIASAMFAFGYLGVLPSFLVQLRWTAHGADATPLYLLATVLAAKGADIGAYAVGRGLGRSPMAPRLSPKKTWEGFAGGIALAALLVASLEWGRPLFRHGIIEASLFGATVGTAGVLGDLAESMLKRDARAKDAAATIPGFGGILDVFDSLIFAGPVAYLWLTLELV